MGVGRDPLPEGWDDSIPETLWPDAIIACVRMDLGALASPRVITSLIAWRKALRFSKDPMVREEARRRLRGVCAALMGEEESGSVEEKLAITDSAVRAFVNSVASGRGEDQTVDAYDLEAEQAGLRRPVVVSTPLGGAAPVEEPREAPTGASDRLAAETRAIDGPGLGSLREALRDDERRRSEKRRTPPPPPPRDASSMLGAVPDAEGVLAEGPTTAMSVSKIAPELRDPKRRSELRQDAARPEVSGVVKVTGVRRTGQHAEPPPPPAPPKPRAAIAQVRALYSAVIGFCEELIPLSYERRARRFWAHWREVSGDRGVRRELVEELLKTSNDAASLVSGLIAEVQNVDLESVKALVAKIETSPRAPKADTNTRVPVVRPSGGTPVEVVAAQIDLTPKREG